MITITRKQDTRRNGNAIVADSLEEAKKLINEDIKRLELLAIKKMGWVDKEVEISENKLEYKVVFSPMIIFYKPLTFTYIIKGV